MSNKSIFSVLLLSLLIATGACRKEQAAEANAVIRFRLSDEVSPVYAIIRLEEAVRTANLILDDRFVSAGNGQDSFAIYISEPGMHSIVVNATGNDNRKVNETIEFEVPPAAKEIILSGFVKQGMSGNYFQQDSVAVGLRYYDNKTDLTHYMTFSGSFLNNNDTVIFDQPIHFDVFANDDYTIDSISRISILMETMPTMAVPYQVYFGGGFYVGAAYWERLYVEKNQINLNGINENRQLKLLVKWK